MVTKKSCMMMPYFKAVDVDRFSHLERLTKDEYDSKYERKTEYGGVLIFSSL